MRELLKVPNEPILRQKCKTIKEITPEVKELAEEMIEFMEHYQDGKTILIGFSAPQLGETIRMIAFRHNPYSAEPNIQVVINPELIYAKKKARVYETCLSIPGKRFNIKRAKMVKIRGLTLTGEVRTFKGRDILAQIFQHELNHLDGILIDTLE